MESTYSYGVIVRILRRRAGLSLQKAAHNFGRSSGWLSEIETGSGTCRLTAAEFDEIVVLLGGAKDRPQFKTWIAAIKNQDRTSKQFDGAVIKFIRIKKGISLAKASKLLTLSKGYLSKLENGLRPVTLEQRNHMMTAYGYNPSSFKNLSTDPVRSKAVPSRFKFEIMLRKFSPEQAEEFFQHAVRTLPSGRFAHETVQSTSNEEEL